MNQSRQSLFPSKTKGQSYAAEIFNLYYSNSLEASLFDLAETYPELKTLHEMLSNNPVIQRLFNTVMENYQAHAYKDALFFIDKLMTLTKNHASITYLLGECYFQNGDYKKVHSLFSKHNLINYNQEYQLLTVRSLVKNIEKSFLL